MNSLKYLLVCLMIVGASPVHASLISIESRFTQDGFSGGGSVSGFFRGTDLNGDGRLLSVSPLVSGITGVELSNELEYAEITFSGLGTSLGSQTLVYDKSIADVTALQNLFFGFAYNIGSASIGDEANEGISFSVFAPSTNYLLGEAFFNLFASSISGIDLSSFGSCGSAVYCSAVLELVPDANSPDGIRTFSQNLSAELVVVSEPGNVSLLSLALFSILLNSRRKIVNAAL